MKYDIQTEFFNACLGGPFICPKCHKKVKQAQHKPCWLETISKTEVEVNKFLQKHAKHRGLCSLVKAAPVWFFLSHTPSTFLFIAYPLPGPYYIISDIANCIHKHLNNEIPQIDTRENRQALKLLFSLGKRLKHIKKRIMYFYNKNRKYILLLDITSKLLERNSWLIYHRNSENKCQYHCSPYLLDLLFSILPKEKIAEMLKTYYSSCASQFADQINLLITTVYKNITRQRYLKYSLYKSNNRLIIEDVKNNKKYLLNMSFIICDVCLKCMRGGNIYMCWGKLLRKKGRSIAKEADLCLKEIQNPITDLTKFPRIIFCQDCFDMASNQLYFTLAGAIKILNEAFSEKGGEK